MHPATAIPVAFTKATPLTANQIRGFWAAWGGWALDVMFLSISIGFGYVFYLADNALPIFFVVLFFLGLSGAKFRDVYLPLHRHCDFNCAKATSTF